MQQGQQCNIVISGIFLPTQVTRQLKRKRVFSSIAPLSEEPMARDFTPEGVLQVIKL